MKRKLAAAALGMVLALGLGGAAMAGGINGPIAHRDTVWAHRTDVYNMTFVAGEVAEIAVSGDGSTDLDLYVYDGYGRLVGTDTDAGDDCDVRFVVIATGTFRVEVVNHGSVYNDYVIAHN